MLVVIIRPRRLWLEYKRLREAISKEKIPLSRIEKLGKKMPGVGRLREKVPRAKKPKEKAPKSTYRSVFALADTTTTPHFWDCFSLFCCLIFSQGSYT